MARIEFIQHEELRTLLKYDPGTGLFTRLKTTGGRYGAKAGTVAGGPFKDGYTLISVKSVQYRAHRLAWFYMTGNWPVGEIDHINGQRSDNRWSNLRDVPAQMNAQNKRTAQRNSRTGLLGASWSSRDRRYVARIRIDGKYRSLGGFDTAEEAHAAYIKAKRISHQGCTI